MLTSSILIFSRRSKKKRCNAGPAQPTGWHFAKMIHPASERSYTLCETRSLSLKEGKDCPRAVTSSSSTSEWRPWRLPAALSTQLCSPSQSAGLLQRGLPQSSEVAGVNLPEGNWAQCSENRCSQFPSLPLLPESPLPDSMNRNRPMFPFVSLLPRYSDHRWELWARFSFHARGLKPSKALCWAAGKMRMGSHCVLLYYLWGACIRISWRACWKHRFFSWMSEIDSFSPEWDLGMWILTTVLQWFW